MKLNPSFKETGVVIAMLIAVWMPLGTFGQSCGDCHVNEYSKWIHSVHASTQVDVAGELRDSHPGESPDTVIQGEDCIACHAPTAVLVNGGITNQMTEAQALGYFFTTSNGVFTADTTVTNTADWPQVECTACHNPHDPTVPSYFNSQTGQYETMTNSAELCGQCHGNLHFADTDHQAYNGWMMSKHAITQVDVAGELRDSHPGESPDAVIAGEDCIACHAPTAVLANGGMTEGQALGHFFSTDNGVFSATTTATNTADWPNVDCATCHDPHDAGKFSYFNSQTLQYEVMTNADELCGQCHGNLHFPDTDHLTYNLATGTSGIGVPDQQWMPGVTCEQCHMYASDVDGSNSKMFKGHTWAVIVPEASGTDTISCQVCHPGATDSSVNWAVTACQGQFQALDATAQANVARAAAVLQHSQDTNWLTVLAQAQYNLTYAESDESGGFHNFSYLWALLDNANSNALSIPILDVTMQGADVVISWTGGGTLQSAGAMNGPWNDVPDATNPLVISPAAQVRQQFYRLRP
jgi:Cytochrome c552/Doubled CXXCH motif (Paired_CXXCH_1)/Cytochrome c554 and c-prime